MHPDCYYLIQSKAEYKEFIRFHPVWYRTLNRHPDLMPKFIEAAREYHGQTLPQRLERWQKNINMVSTVIRLFK
ncbi:hypothetical protein D7Z54_30320 [Salibacterium salarium]|uniref:YlbE-like protein n=1 Tax=Salibacterium salarium TaxID=284579 RepID=A0A3R9WMK0_9BACI|nr:YlbE-like family protein [Salibacterium salarium]RSL29591.1 hypothetical protein D7Z54_30320 [Salibacterium salarium]